MTMNPELDTRTYASGFIQVRRRRILRVVRVNYRDNPWFPAVLEVEHQHAGDHGQGRLREHLGRQSATAVLGRDRAEEIAAAIEQGRVADVAYDPHV